MSGNTFPKYVCLKGQGGSAIVLTKVRSGVATYHRPAGVWDVKARWRDGKLITTKHPVADSLSHVELVKTTEEFFMEDNAGYV